MKMKTTGLIVVIRAAIFCTIWTALAICPTFAQQNEDGSKRTVTETSETARGQRLTLVVMDPLSSRLACECVDGFAQRDYEKFGYFLASRTGRPVHVVFAESLDEALEETKGKADIVIGKYSVIRDQAPKANLALKPTFSLTDQKDSTSQTGLIVVRAKNSAQRISDLEGYRILFGPSHCDEKHAAPHELLKEAGIKIADKPPTDDICSTCSVAAKELMAVGDEEKIAGVISNYALRLLEGCGNIQKGDLRVVGESKPVPFVTVFFNGNFCNSESAQLDEVFQDVELEAELLQALETGSGFVPWVEPSAETSPQGVGQEAQIDSAPAKVLTEDAKKKN
jgi:ABC-type phosphate/phosphonate transport system substrate-binding protein